MTTVPVRPVLVNISEEHLPLWALANRLEVAALRFDTVIEIAGGLSDDQRRRCRDSVRHVREAHANAHWFLLTSARERRHERVTTALYSSYVVGLVAFVVVLLSLWR